MALYRFSRQRAAPQANLPVGAIGRASSSLAITPANGWCCTASIDEVSDSVKLQRVSGYPNADQEAIRKISERSFDLTTSNDWMEYLEITGHRETIEGGAGAYDTMRCDLVNGTRVNSWGTDFHLERLCASYGSLREQILETSESSSHSRLRESPVVQLSIEQAMTKSKKIIESLLAEASSVKIMKSSLAHFQTLHSSPETAVKDVVIQLIKLTVLWTPPSGDSEILVRGHACSTCNPMYVHEPPTPIVTTMALPLHHTTNDEEVEEILPNRMQSPQTKVASWCRNRRPLEDPHTYKPPGIGEVLMVRPVRGNSNGDMEILEGLTSNFFAIYKDGTMKTAFDGVLYGYVRHLVLTCADRCGLKVSSDPILLQDAAGGKWESTFITSSSRLIYPIRRILVPVGEDDQSGEDDDMVFRELWKDETFDDDGSSRGKPRWSVLLNEVLRQGGYPND